MSDDAKQQQEMQQPPYQPMMQPQPQQPYQQPQQPYQQPQQHQQPQQPYYQPPPTPPPYSPKQPPNMQQGYAVPHPMGVSAPPVHTVTNFGAKPTPTMCPNCNSCVVSQLRYRPGLLTFLAGAFLAFFTLFCCFLPFLIDDLKDVEHLCPHCGAVLGVFNRL